MEWFNFSAQKNEFRGESRRKKKEMRFTATHIQLTNDALRTFLECFDRRRNNEFRLSAIVKQLISTLVSFGFVKCFQLWIGMTVELQSVWWHQNNAKWKTKNACNKIRIQNNWCVHQQHNQCSNSTNNFVSVVIDALSNFVQRTYNGSAWNECQMTHTHTHTEKCQMNIYYNQLLQHTKCTQYMLHTMHSTRDDNTHFNGKKSSLATKTFDEFFRSQNSLNLIQFKLSCTQAKAFNMKQKVDNLSECLLI